MTVGQALAAKRGERGLTIEQVEASTRIRADHLRALEADQLDRLPAPVYAKGYLRTYATYLGLDAEELVAGLPRNGRAPNLALGMEKTERRPRFVLTTPAIAAAGLVLLAGAFTGYAWRQVAADQRAAVVFASPSVVTGAQVTAAYGERRQAQAVLAQSSYLSANDRRLHFGLGPETQASLEIRWPNGKEEKVMDVAADQLVVIREGSGIIRKESFDRRPVK